MKYIFNFRTQYNQFYLSDKVSPFHIDSDSFWTKEAHTARLAIEEGVLGIGTQSYGHIKGELHVLSKINQNVDYNQYDHIVEGSIEVKSDVLEILDCPNSNIELQVKISPGKYRVRIYSSNLSSAILDEYEGDDYYKIEIWPNNIVKRKVLKQYSGI